MRCALVALLIVAGLACFAPAVTKAYSTTYTARNSPAGTFAFDPLAPDFCTLQDSASHTAMSVSAPVQAALQSAYNREGFRRNIPLGGMTQQAVCTGAQCQWHWYRGLYTTTRPLFLQGVYYWGMDDVTPPVDRTIAVPGAYTNFDISYPRSWGNLSYWGKRLVVMQPSGKWVNTEISTTFSNFLCEYYVYADSDGVNGLMPTFPGGSVIPLVSSSDHTYTFCDIKVDTDSLGRWILPKCHKGLPWWGGLILAVVFYIVFIALIIGTWCYCCIRRRSKKEKQRQVVISSKRDNQSDIPFQSELGMSRNGFSSHNSTYNSRAASVLCEDAPVQKE